MHNSDSLLFKIAITLIPRVGVYTAKNLISYCGGVDEVFNASIQQLMKIPGVGYEIAKSIKQSDALKNAEKEIEFINRNQVKPLFYLDEAYPQRLKHFPDAPIMLYSKGNHNLNADRTVAIIGTRNPSYYGTSTAEAIVDSLKAYNVLMISGLAYGIDIAAHKACLSCGVATVGVLGHGLSSFYPVQHQGIANRMLENGGIITEFSSNTLPDGRHFPMRNRIIAGLSDAVIVVETAKKGGSIITANIANSYNKDVFAIPGRHNDHRSAGCNWLIKAHKASLMESIDDLVYLMNWDDNVNKMERLSIQKELLLDLNEHEQQIMQLFETKDQIALDHISYHTKLKNSEVASLILGLEFKGALKSIPGNQYVKI